MNLENLKDKALRICLTPPELLYVVTRHWLLIASLFFLGGTLMFGKVLTDTTMYRGKTRLLVNGSAGDAVESGRRNTRADDDQFLRSQLEVMSSDSVFRKVVVQLGLDQLPAKEDTSTGVKRFAKQVRRLMTSWRSWFSSNEIRDFGEERNTQLAIRYFRERASLTSDPRTGIVEMVLVNSSRDALKSELETWAQAYRARMSEMAKDTYDSFFHSRTEYWKSIEEAAQEKLAAFQRDNPDVSEIALRTLTQESVDLQVLRSELQRRLETGDWDPDADARDASAAPVDPALSALRSRKVDLALALADARSRYKADSYRVQAIERRLAEVDKQLQDREVASDPQSSEEELTDLQKELLLREQIDRLARQLNEKMAKEVALKARLEELKDLEAHYRKAKSVREDYANGLLQLEDRIDSDGKVRVTVVDPPVVATRPLNPDPARQIAIGSGSGLVLGLLLAFVFEMLNRKVRFKNDVEEDLGVSVIGVVPRR